MGQRFFSRVLLGMCLIVLTLLPNSFKDFAPLRGSWTLDPALLQTGDLIFRRGQSLGSQVVLDSDPQSPFSHVGLVLKQNSQAWVIHIVPTTALGRDDVARIDSLETFLSFKDTTQIAVYRIQPEKQAYAETATRMAKDYVTRKIPFDPVFDLTTPEKLYCTELVWRAYLEAGLDLVEGQFDRVDFPFADGSYLLPSRLLASPYLRLVLTLPK